MQFCFRELDYSPLGHGLKEKVPSQKSKRPGPEWG